MIITSLSSVFFDKPIVIQLPKLYNIFAKMTCKNAKITCFKKSSAGGQRRREEQEPALLRDREDLKVDFRAVLFFLLDGAFQIRYYIGYRINCPPRA